jgi:hypothetical protein
MYLSNIEVFKTMCQTLLSWAARIVMISLKTVEPSEIRDQWSTLGAFLCEALLYDGLSHHAAGRSQTIPDS